MKAQDGDSATIGAGLGSGVQLVHSLSAPAAAATPASAAPEPAKVLPHQPNASASSSTSTATASAWLGPLSGGSAGTAAATAGAGGLRDEITAMTTALEQNARQRHTQLQQEQQQREQRQWKQHCDGDGMPQRSIASAYEMGQELGKGAFSVVYRAKCRASGRTVAVKVIQFACFSDAERARQERILDNEIKIMRKIATDCDGTNLIQIIDVVREQNRLAIVMEVLEGKELFDRIVARQRYTEADAAFLMNKIMLSIQTLHRAGIVHRDLKPENLVFASEAEDAEVKITDFGLAMVTSWPDVHKTVVGTPNYVAPEVVSIQPRGPFYGPACDVWSMGVILYILLVGYPPFFHDNVRELFKLIRRGDYTFHEDQWGNVSPGAKDLVAKMLKVRPEQRLTSGQVLAHPWMQSAPNSSLMGSQVQMKKLRAKQRFRAAAMAVVWGAQLGMRRKLTSLVEASEANIFKLDELQRIRTAFQMHAAHNETMGHAAFHATMKRLGFDHVPTDRLFELFDKNGDGTIDYKEFLSSLTTLRESGEKALKMCFDVYDSQGNGSISRQDVGLVLASVLRTADDQVGTLERIFQRMDTDGDGRISYSEFKQNIFAEPLLVQSFLQPMDDLAALPAENFTVSDLDRGVIDSRYLRE